MARRGLGIERDHAAFCRAMHPLLAGIIGSGTTLALTFGAPKVAEAGGCVPRVAVIDVSRTLAGQSTKRAQLAKTQRALIEDLKAALIPALNGTGGSQFVELPQPPSKSLARSLRRLMSGTLKSNNLPRWFPRRASLRELRMKTGDTIDTVALIDVNPRLEAPMVRLVVIGIYGGEIGLVLRVGSFGNSATTPAAEVTAWAASGTGCDDS